MEKEGINEEHIENKEYTQCESCGKKIAENGPYTTDEGHAYCSACAKVLKETCSVCKKKFNTWQMTGTSHNEYYCEKCATAIG